MPGYAETGLRLTCAAGRERYGRGHADRGEPPIGELLCPVRLVAAVRESRERPLGHLDAECLRADGRLDTCTHTDGHPTTRHDDIRHGLPQVYAPEEFPATEHTRTLESWTCPRFTVVLAAGCASGLEGLAEDA